MKMKAVRGMVYHCNIKIYIKDPACQISILESDGKYILIFIMIFIAANIVRKDNNLLYITNHY